MVSSTQSSKGNYAHIEHRLSAEGTRIHPQITYTGSASRIASTSATVGRRDESTSKHFSIMSHTSSESSGWSGRSNRAGAESTAVVIPSADRGGGLRANSYRMLLSRRFEPKRESTTSQASRPNAYMSFALEISISRVRRIQSLRHSQ